MNANVLAIGFSLLAIVVSSLNLFFVVRTRRKP